MEPLADITDVENVFRPLSRSEEQLGEGLIDQISSKLRIEARRRGQNIDDLLSDELTAEAIKTAVVNAVKRVLMNPEAIRQMSTTTGPMSESRTIDAAVSSGLLYLDPSDLADVFPTNNRSKFRSFHVRAGLR
jgi:hypothetical protein